MKTIKKKCCVYKQTEDWLISSRTSGPERTSAIQILLHTATTLRQVTIS